MKCQYCHKKFSPTSNSQKFCSKICRTKDGYTTRQSKFGARYQKDSYQRKLREKYSEDELVQCLFCGRYFRQIGTHVVETHKYESAREYREEYGLDVKKGILPPDYKDFKAYQAVVCGGVKNLSKGRKYRFKKGHSHNYQRSKQTLERLKVLYKLRKVRNE